jgi:S1-C subfamily serine protease
VSDVSRRYVGSLAVVAVLVLTGGLLLRSRLYPTPIETAPPSEASTLRQLSQEAQLRRTAAYVAGQVEAMAAGVQYVPATGASGLWWTPDTLLSSSRGRSIVPITRAELSADEGQPVDSARRGIVIAADSTNVGWIVLAGRDSGGAVISAQFLASGRATTTCDGTRIQRYVLGAPLEGSLAGAGVFRLDGTVLGLAAWCDGALVAVPADEVRRLLAERRDPPLESRLGFRVASASPLVRSFVGSDTALLVTFVRAGSVADDAGLEAGDVLVTVDGRAAAAATERLAAAPAAPTDSLVLVRRRERGVATVTLRPATDSVRGEAFGVELAAPVASQGVPLARIRSGSPAARAGLRAGDRLVRVGSADVTTAAADRLLATAGGDEGPTLVVVARDDGEHALLVAADAPTAAVDSAPAIR